MCVCVCVRFAKAALCSSAVWAGGAGLPLRTWEVAAAPGGAAAAPLALVERGAPLLQLAVLQRVRGQVADLQPAELPQEVAERHPVRWGEGRGVRKREP